jgi:hypothetical protein
MTRRAPLVLTMVFLATLAGFVLHSNSGRWRCYRNLTWIDHALNCNGCIQMGNWHLAPVVSAIGAIACGVWALMPFMARPPTPPPT